MLDIRDISIIDSLPFEYSTVLDIGCGHARVLKWLANNTQKKHFGIDIKDHKWQSYKDLKFAIADIFNVNTWNIKKPDVIICSQVLEHLKDWRKALETIVNQAKKRIIITVPYDKSFYDPSHVNFWTENNINEFEIKPYSISWMKIRTKPKDVDMKQYGWLIIIDKNQCYG
jgi:SAM-dependent methyltransferase